MAQIKTRTMDGKAGAALEVDERLAETPFHPFLIHDAVVYRQAKVRRGNHSTKTRAEVAGSTKKLWRQKGTGRARTGNAKAPHRRHGGVAHGPHPRSHDLKINRKVSMAALRSAIAEGLRSETLVVLESLEPKTHKTKALALLLGKLDAPRTLIVVDEVGPNLGLAVSNLAGVELIHHTQLNVYALLKHPKALFTQKAFEAVQERLAG